MRFEEWVKEVPEAFKSDPLWSVSVYRLATYPFTHYASRMTHHKPCITSPGR